MISLIVAAARNNAIGKDNRLLWHLPADLQHFKKITSGHTIIMGRRTFDSIGKPLPNRRNIIITRSLHGILGGEISSSLPAALSMCADEQEVFVIGGGEIYREALPLADRIYLTRVEAEPEADVFFPELNPDEWQEISCEAHKPDEKNTLAYTFITLEKRP
ncbi:MAG: dihydrofolate reductase [Mucilaginibacter polytrichastri]|nr:dihydrofolate reductase [Mucilaginibacter polytrichastri]